MNRTFISILVGIVTLCLFISIPGYCLGDVGQVAGAATLTDAEAMQADAQEISRMLREGEYADIYSRFDATLKSALSEEQFIAGWEQAVAMFGEYASLGSVTGADVGGGLYSVEVVELYAVGGLKLTIVYSAQGEISGLSIVKAVLPQEAQSSDTWTESKVIVAGDESMPLNGMLTLPRESENPPVVIFLHGSGSSDMNESIGTAGNAPFRDIAHGLAERGIASLRYDKRSYVYPHAFAELSKVTLEQEALDDVYAAIALMQADERVDGTRIFVLGHSLGGMLVPAIAQAQPELAGVISMAGTLRQLWDVVYDQNMEAFNAIEGLPEDQMSLLNAQMAQLDVDIELMRSGRFRNMADTDVLMSIPVGYWKSLDSVNGMNFIGDVTLPMLILQGGADFQVYPDADYQLWLETLAARDNVVFQLYDGLNHLMMPTTGLRSIEDYNLAANVSEDVIDDIAAFVNAI